VSRGEFLRDLRAALRLQESKRGSFCAISIPLPRRNFSPAAGREDGLQPPAPAEMSRDIASPREKRDNVRARARATLSACCRNPFGTPWEFSGYFFNVG